MDSSVSRGEKVRTVQPRAFPESRDSLTVLAVPGEAVGGVSECEDSLLNAVRHGGSLGSFIGPWHQPSVVMHST